MATPEQEARGTGAVDEAPAPEALTERARELMLRESRARLRRYGRAAGFLFIAAALSGIPAALLRDPPPSSWIYPLTALSVLIGLLCIVAIPWERAARWWFHALTIAGTIVIALATALDEGRSVFYVFVAVYAAYVFPSRRDVVLQLSIVALALFAPVLYGQAGVRESLELPLLVLPTLVLVAGTVIYLRERLESQKLTYRRFATEALEIAQRIPRR